MQLRRGLIHPGFILLISAFAFTACDQADGPVDTETLPDPGPQIESVTGGDDPGHPALSSLPSPGAATPGNPVSGDETGFSADSSDADTVSGTGTVSLSADPVGTVDVNGGFDPGMD